MLIRVYHIIIICLCLVNSALGQMPGIEWQFGFGGSDDDKIAKIIQTSDGGFLIAGFSKSDSSYYKSENCLGVDDFGYPAYDYWIVKTNGIGEIEWENTIGGGEIDIVTDAIETSSGNFCIVGYSSSNDSEDKAENSFVYDYWIVNLNPAGEIIWENTIGGNSNDYATGIVETNDHGFIIAGYSGSNISGDKTEDRIFTGTVANDYWIVKIDSVGQVVWDNTIGGFDEDKATGIIKKDDDHFIVYGYSSSYYGFDKADFQGGYDNWLVEIDESGIITDQKVIGGSIDEKLTCMTTAPDGGYFIGCYSDSYASGDKSEGDIGDTGNDDYWVVKTDSDLNVEWENTIGTIDPDWLTSIISLPDSRVVVCGYTAGGITGDKSEESIGGYDFWILQLATDGNVEWQATIGGDGSEYSPVLCNISDYGFLIGGYTSSGVSGDKTSELLGGSDEWILKFSCSMYNEICNDADDNCNGLIDEGVPLHTFYLDYDSDNYGNIFVTAISCYDTLNLFVQDSTDCNDTDPAIYPGAIEYNDGIDNNCNDSIDEGFLAVEENNFSNLISIYPNPNNGTFILSAQSAQSAKSAPACLGCEAARRGVNIQIYNSLGQLIYYEDLISSTQTISLDNISSGIYFVRIGDGNNYAEQKLIIEN